MFENHRKSIIKHCERSEATCTFWVDKSCLKMPKMVHFGEFLKIWRLRSNSVTRQVSFNRTKIDGKCQNSNGTFWVHFSTFQQNSGEMRHLRYFLNTVLLKLILEGKQLQKTDRNELHTIFNFKCCFIFRRHTKKLMYHILRSKNMTSTCRDFN